MRRISSAAALTLIFVLFFSVATAASTLAEGLNAKDKAKLDLERIDFVHYVKNGAKSKPQDPGYKLMGYKWGATPVNYNINPTNSNLDGAQVASSISAAAETWDAQTGAELFNNTYTVDSGAKYGVQDYKNSITFGPYSDNRVIAITSIWFSRKTGKIIEFDMLFNTYYKWGDVVTTWDSSLMDLQNIATHELGHSVGLDDIYNSTYSAVTMYGYSNNGETSKRTLEQPDLTGLKNMYGN